MAQFMVKSMQENNKIKEIMARYRPIAPMPPPLAPAPAFNDPVMKSCSRSTPLYLQSRPCRVRKRGRPSLASFQVEKRHKPLVCASKSSTDAVATTSRVNSFVPYTTQVPVLTHGFSPVPVSSAIIQTKSFETSKDPLTLSLVPYSGSGLITGTEIRRDVPVEKNLLNKLMEKKDKPELIKPKVLIPQPVRPVGSSIFVGCIDPIASSSELSPIGKTPGEIEQEMEAETIPTVVSDSENKVRLTNSAYKKLVGQPECLWLEMVVKSPCKRINGGVKLLVPELLMPKSLTGFTCRVKIEWALDGIRNYVCAPCDVRRLYCDSRDYLFIWKFRTGEGYVSSCKGYSKDGAVW